MIRSSSKILVVDDDIGIRTAIRDYLDGFGVRTLLAADAVEMERVLATESVDLIVLDVMMPGEDGLAVCRRRGDSGVPILMLSALGDPADRIVGLELGASDYLAKPFEPRELLARVRALLRRQVAPSEGPRIARQWSFSGWSFDGETRRLTRPNGAEVVLTSAQAALLKVFLERPGRLLTRDQLMTLTRGGSAEVFDRAIDLSVSRLRRLLGDQDRTPLIETVRGEGYRLRPAHPPS
ncbi:response regulator (plasmid) [Brevundimonas staleyi]|uniref:Response regulator n=1 Tax=Brevundimonas staleyi TaxID=74326 RepID=A0ABW0FQ53_9CAUL